MGGGRQFCTISVYGQEAQLDTWRMAKINLAIRGIEADFGDENADTFFNDKHKDKEFDVIFANPPFNLKAWGQEKLIDDVRWKYGIPPANNANYAWIQHMIHHLAPKGKIGLVLANGALTSMTGGEGEIRKNIIEADLVEAIVALPSQLFYSVQIPVSLWFFNRAKKQARKTVFIDARGMGVMEDRTHKIITHEEIKKIAKTVHDFQAGKDVDEKGFAAVVTTERIAEEDYRLTPGVYVGIAEKEDDGEPIKEKMARLQKELMAMFEESHKLEDEIKKQLAGLKL